MSTAHVFEAAGLGKAPFKFVGVEERRGPITFVNAAGVTCSVGSPGQPMGCCDFCGEGIAVCCTIQSADGKRFVVGNVCVNKTADAGLVAPVKKALARRTADLRLAKAQATSLWIRANLERARPVLEQAPHPNGFAGKTAYDWAVWMAVHAGAAGRAQVAAVMRGALPEAA